MYKDDDLERRWALFATALIMVAYVKVSIDVLLVLRDWLCKESGDVQ